ncbi:MULTISPECIES: galactokinase [Pseudoalteromonas]|mgnify:CR=1 FL=1|uniref:Galactokinase n=1 Tax=Pseudoalteromonas arctica A 37-1-2 TaxID=1117313 RepID=A0A290S632_9GAMM|nr:MULTISPECIES: galactokinase [Pseudoalteromonas]ATC86690.1 galactokinase [Pseudoalteromonas arctica A 37-1-2]MBH0018813.1 galactokinase [Pseudoalteromonas sp. SWXJ133]MDN3383446.1 galactokinase [Pseudoalteromonas sp. APC 3358]GAA67684.1 galactokinase [Pseudoalteromonas sp. BSi20429]
MNVEQSARLAFSNHFGRDADFVVKAPGRVNLIGEHTDYNDGFVLPCAIEYATYIAVSPRTDDVVNVLALDCDNQTDNFLVNKPLNSHSTQTWSNYVRGVVDELQKRNHKLSGCDICITGNVPQGAGLSSSAALEVGIAYAFNHLCELFIERKDIAKIAQAAENNFVGCNCGIMDQLISACGQQGQALGIDCRSLDLIEVSIDPKMTILMVNSNVKRGLLDSEYNLRREQCYAGAEALSKPSLREVSIGEYESKKHTLDPSVAKRVEHIVYENVRTLEAMQAFTNNDIAKLSTLMAQSHASMRDLFEITTSQIDTLVNIIAKVINEHGGVRMTGGGFGGCVVAFVPNFLVENVISAIETQYEQQTGLKETIYTSVPSAGVSLIRA